jgi:hypothetical protein
MCVHVFSHVSTSLACARRHYIHPRAPLHWNPHGRTHEYVQTHPPQGRPAPSATRACVPIRRPALFAARASGPIRREGVHGQRAASIRMWGPGENSAEHSAAKITTPTLATCMQFPTADVFRAVAVSSCTLAAAAKSSYTGKPMQAAFSRPSIHRPCIGDHHGDARRRNVGNTDVLDKPLKAGVSPKSKTHSAESAGWWPPCRLFHISMYPWRDAR